MPGRFRTERAASRANGRSAIHAYALAGLIAVGLAGCAKDKEYVTPESEVAATDAFVVVGNKVVNVTPGHSHKSTMFCARLNGQIFNYGMNWLQFDPVKRALIGHNTRPQSIAHQTEKGGFTIYRKQGQCAWPGPQDESCLPDKGVAYSVVRVQPGTYVLSSYYMDRAIPTSFMTRTWVLSKNDLDDDIPFDPDDGTHIFFTVEQGETAYLGTYTFDFQLPASYPDDCMIDLIFDWDEIRETRGPGEIIDVSNELSAVQEFMKAEFPNVPLPVAFRPPENVEILPTIAKMRAE